MHHSRNAVATAGLLLALAPLAVGGTGAGAWAMRPEPADPSPIAHGSRTADRLVIATHARNVRAELSGLR